MIDAESVLSLSGNDSVPRISVAPERKALVALTHSQSGIWHPPDDQLAVIISSKPRRYFCWLVCFCVCPNGSITTKPTPKPSGRRLNPPAGPSHDGYSITGIPAEGRETTRAYGRRPSILAVRTCSATLDASHLFLCAVTSGRQSVPLSCSTAAARRPAPVRQIRDDLLRHQDKWRSQPCPPSIA